MNFGCLFLLLLQRLLLLLLLVHGWENSMAVKDRVVVVVVVVGFFFRPKMKRLRDEPDRSDFKAMAGLHAQPVVPSENSGVSAAQQLVQWHSPNAVCLH